jgi:hypothetical protein
MTIMSTVLLIGWVAVLGAAFYLSLRLLKKLDLY